MSLAAELWDFVYLSVWFLLAMFIDQVNVKWGWADPLKFSHVRLKAVLQGF